jgi:hypothetical protein
MLSVVPNNYTMSIMQAIESLVETPKPIEVQLSPEKQENIKAITAHEGAHAFVSLKLGIPLMKIEMNIENGKQSGGVVWSDIQGVTPEMQGISYTAGLAGELVVLGEDYVRNSGFKGLRTDSKRLNHLGYVSQEDKARLLTEAIGIITTNQDEFEEFRTTLERELVETAKKGSDKVLLDRDRLTELGMQRPEKVLH